MKRLLLGLVIISLMAGIVLAEGVNIKDIGLGERQVAASEKSSNKKLWQSTLLVKEVSFEGEPFIYVEDNGSGIYGKDKQYLTWRVRTYARLVKDQLEPYQVEAVYKTRNGEVTRKLEKFYDIKNNEVLCVDEDGERRFDFKDDLLDKELLGLAMRNYPFEKKNKIEFHLLTHEPVLYKVTMEYKGRETITLGTKEVECYKLELIPHLGALSIFSAFVPKTFFWYTADDAREFVRYEGLESGLGTPYIVLEAVQGGKR